MACRGVNSLKRIRLSSVSLALLTVGAVLGVTTPADAQTAAPNPTEVHHDGLSSAPPNLADSALATEPTSESPAQIALNPAPSLKITPDAVSQPETLTAEPSAPSDRLALQNALPQASEAIAALHKAELTASDPTASSDLADVTAPDLTALIAQVTSPSDDPLIDPSLLPPQTNPPTPSTPAATEDEARVLVAEVLVSGAPPELENVVYDAISTRPGFTTTRSQLQADVNAVYGTGYFSNVQTVPEDTPLGVRITFLVQPNPVLQGVQVQGSQVLPPEVVNDIFSPQYGSVINLNQLQRGIESLNTWYQDNGYVLAQVIDAPRVNPNGQVTLVVAEGEIEDIQVRFINEDGETTDEDGEPIDGRTRDFIITREFESQPGDVFNQQQIQEDLQRAFQLGIFEDLRVSLNPGDDPRKVDVIINVQEARTGSLAAGVGISSASGLFGTVSYQEQNLGGNNQRVSAELQLGERDLLFDVAFTDPWIAGDPYRTSYTVNAFSRRSIPLVFTGGENEVYLENGDRPRVRRLGGGISFARPLDDGWRASLGLQYQNVRLQDSDGDLEFEDELGNTLSFGDDGTDDLLTVQFSASQDRRNSTVSPTSGSVLRLSTEQSIPIGGIFFNRLRGSYSYYVPVNLTEFTDGPETLAFNVQGGLVLGDLPPYEAFSLGGTDSVRGYDSGEVGSGRAFVLGTVEYRFPIFSIIGGALFVDIGSTLGTDDDVPGEPSIVRDKPGFGLGFGLGVRVQSPIGAIRIDYAFSDEGEGRLHFGIGERF